MHIINRQAFFNLLKYDFSFSPLFYRFARVKARKTSRNRRRNTPGKYRTIHVDDGDWVEEGQVLALQHTFAFYPGMNSVVRRRPYGMKSLVSDCPGYVKFSVEEFQPPFNSDLYNVMKARNTSSLVGRFIHVITPEYPNRFRLISLT